MDTRLLPVKQFADRLGISIWTARQWCYAGRVASVKLGVKLLVPEQEAERMVVENLRPAVTARSTAGQAVA
jgi:predicted site-specific integrase-resolvase